MRDLELKEAMIKLISKTSSKLMEQHLEQEPPNAAAVILVFSVDDTGDRHMTGQLLPHGQLPIRETRALIDAVIANADPRAVQ